MRRIAAALIILLAAFASARSSSAATPPVTSDWASLNADAAQSNYNPVEKAISAKNVLKLKVRWSVPLPDVSYPVVAADKVYVPVVSQGKIHVRALNATNGKGVTSYTKDAQGGILVRSGTLYLAGHVLQAVDGATGQKLAQIDPAVRAPRNIYVNPQSDTKYIVAGYASGANSSIVAVDPTSNQTVRRMASTNAFSTVIGTRILTATAPRTTFYEETTGKAVARLAYVGSNWFSGNTLAYTVASVKRGNASLYAFNRYGKKMWSHVVGPLLATQNSDWPHAVTPDTLYVQTMRPQSAIQALDPTTGKVRWTRPVRDVIRIAAVNDVVLVLTYNLGQPVQLVALKAKTGAVIGAVVLKGGYYGFASQNGLMVAAGMVFLRAVGPGGSQLIAFSAPSS